MKRGFTLIELIIVVIIIGILATMAVPQYLKAAERARVGKAKNALSLISGAEKMYRADKDTYTSTITDLEAYMEMGQITADSDWTHSVVGNVNTFTAKATRKTTATAYSGKTITLTGAGVFAGNHPLR